MDESGYSISTDYGNSLLPDSDVLSDLQATGGRPFDEHLDTDFFGISEAELSLAFLDHEEDSTSAFGDLSESDQAAFDHLSISGKTRTAKKPGIVTAEDFEDGPQRQAFEIIREHALAYCGRGKYKPEIRLQAVRWLFCLDEAPGINFDLCCRVLNARKDVIRLRLNYELWLRWIVFPYEFPFTAVPLPEMVASEILYAVDTIGFAIAQAAWNRPGISTADLLCKASGKDNLEQVPSAYMHALSLLEERFILSVHHDNWFLTGRNPSVAKLRFNQSKGRNLAIGGSVSWSNLF